MSKKIQLEIADPCHENWNNMSPSDKGRFCDSCQKQVVDFTNMSDREIALFFKKPSTGSVCGRFMNDQLNREMEIPKKRIPWVKYFFQVALPAFLFSMRSSAQLGKIDVREKRNDTGMVNTPARPFEMVGDTTAIVIDTPAKKPIVTEIEKASRTALKCKLDDITYTKITMPEIKFEKLEMMTAGFTVVRPVVPQDNIIFKIVNEEDEPVAFASILFTAAGGKKVIGNQASAEGRVTIKSDKKWKKAEIIISSAGYYDKKLEITRRELPAEELIVRLQANAVMPEVAVTSRGWMGLIKRIDVTGSVTSKIKEESSTVKTPDMLPVKTAPVTASSLRVYPNPVLSGNTINIACEKLDEGYYAFQLLNFSGQVIHQREIWVDEKATVLNFELPRTAAGSYVLRMIHKQSGKSFTEKVIIE
jgi:hypothetical protein